MFTHLCIEYADSGNLENSITIPYRLRDNSVVPKWINKVQIAQQQYTIDDPGRFYGFGPIEKQIEHSLSLINNCINIINSHEHIIDRHLTDVNDSDTLNYLHHIFEVYHGLLDQQTHEFFINAPKIVQQALADLNIAVHRCESVARGAYPRHVVTYYGLPKTNTLDNEDYNLFTDIYQKGTVYLNYVEIGKTLEDLAIDNDQYIADEAFKPFRHYSADFCVTFYNSNLEHVFDKRARIKQYYVNHSKFFLDRGLYGNHPYLNMGRIPLADIDLPGEDVLQLLMTRQFVKSVKFI